MEKKVKIRELEKKDRLPYIWEYYKFHIIGTICGLAVVIGFLVHFLTPRKEVVLNLLMVNVDHSVIGDASYFDDFMKKNGYDTSKQEINLNANFTIDLHDDKGTSSSTLQSIYTVFMAGAVDVYMSDEELFQAFADNEEFEPLEDYVSKEFIEKHKDDIVYGTDVETNEKYMAGVCLPKNSKYVKDNLFYLTPVVIGFSGPKVQNYEAQKQFLEYVFDE